MSDNRPGVTDEELLHLFDRFYRVDEARARATGGSGLGLPIVAAIVHAHGGSISASRAEPSGLTVTMRLPRALPRRDASEELRDDADAN